MSAFPASPEAVAAMAVRGIDIGSHMSAPVTSSDLAKADLVIAMTGAHKNALLSRFPEHASKVRTLAEVSLGTVSGDVDDPFGYGQDVYDRAAETIERGLFALSNRLKMLLDE